MFKIIKTIVLIMSGICLLAANPLFYDSLTIPGSKYYVVFNDTNSSLDSVKKICTNYYYFSNKHPLYTYKYNYSYQTPFLIIKAVGSAQCSLSVGQTDKTPTNRNANILNCDSLAEYQYTYIYLNADTIHFSWIYELLAKKRSVSSVESSAPHLRISIYSNGHRADLNISNPGILLSAVKNNTLAKSPLSLQERKYTVLFNSGRQQNIDKKTIYNIRGQLIGKGEKNNLIIEYK